MIRSGQEGPVHPSAGSLEINHMEVAKINGSPFYLFLDIFVHPSREKVVAVVPTYLHDWNELEHGIDYQQVELIIGKTRVRGNYIAHRLDSWEPCALLDFEDEIIQACVITHQGEIVNEMIREHYQK